MAHRVRPRTQSSSSRTSRAREQLHVDEPMRPLAPPARVAVERRDVAGVVYLLEWGKCGKRCHCAEEWPNGGHGPYWYAYYFDDRSRRWRSIYVGKRFRTI